MDTIGPDRGVLISEVEMYTNTVVGEGKGVLFREVSLIQSVLIREGPLYTCYTLLILTPCLHVIYY